MTRSIWAVAVTSLITGAYSFANADGLAAQDDGPIAGATATEYREYGAALLVAGGVASAIGIIDRVRATDSEYDDGVMEGEVTRTESTCRDRKSADREIALVLPNSQQLDGRTNKAGVAELDLSDVPEEGIPGPNHEIAVSGVRVASHVSTTDLDGLRATLLADPTSRVARDVLHKRQDQCASAVATARANVQPAPSDVEPAAQALWSQAKTECHDLWTRELELELVGVDERVLYTECRSRLREAAFAFVDDRSVTVEDMTAELGTLRDLCTAPEHVAQRKVLDAKLAAAIKRVARAEAAERRREQAAAAAERRRAQERARAQRSYQEPDFDTSWTTPSSTTRTCCRMCSTGKACGNSCIARWKTCHKGVGCACDE